MIPLKDNIPSRTTPFVNYLVIGICALAFFRQLAEQPGKPTLIDRYGLVPARVTHPDAEIVFVERVIVETPRGLQVRELSRPAEQPAVPAIFTLLTCIFLHGGWLHFLGNMWFLFIFGDNVEDRIGHFGYLVFYLGCGVAASVAHLVTDPASTVPTIGASGAIAAVMGAYLVLYPRAMVLSLVPIFFFLQIVVLPAPIFLGIWFVIQFFQGTFAITSMQSGGVAWWAHIGGFVTGLVVARLLGKSSRLRPPVERLRPQSDHPGVYRVRPSHWRTRR